MLDRTSPHVLSMLSENEIFVFASCLNGQHKNGEAKVAMQFGAEINKSVGLVGQTYAIPIRHRNYQLLSLEEIEKHVYDFVKFVKRKKDLIFIVTEIACEKKEYQTTEIIKIFKDCFLLENVMLPMSWWRSYHVS